ncbi:MAG: hypothetical protein QF489_10740 [Planctomycetota bacterium]|jgi:hypothetical protein|nr:hypothetical protein [Planctomycetota bacterium]
MTARKPTPNIIVDFRIPFWRMVAIMVKLSIASIPAAIILTAIYAGVVLLFTTLLSVPFAFGAGS